MRTDIKQRLFPDCFLTCVKSLFHQIYIGATIKIRNITHEDTDIQISTKRDHM